MIDRGSVDETGDCLCNLSENSSVPTQRYDTLPSS